MTPVELRPYQERGIRALRDHVNAGRKRVILCGPCASGKTVWAAWITRSARENFNTKILFLVHRIELIDQTVAKFAEFGITDVGVIRADDSRSNLMMPVQVASVWTLARHPEYAMGFDIVFIDEMHLSMSDSYQRVMDLYPNATFIGLTATPHRLDGKPLKDRWDAIEPAATYSDLIRDKFVMAPRIFSPAVKPDLSRVHTRAGEYMTEELEEVMTESSVLGDLVPEWQKHAGGLRTVAFAVSVEHSKSIVKRFLEAGIPAAHIDAQTSLDERKSTLAALEAGELRVVSNVDILTAGWNQPPVKCMIDARPTKSLTRFLQASGRVLRVWKDPETGELVTPVILDHARNVDRHNFPHMDRRWTLDGPAAHSKKAPSVCIKCQSFIEHYPCPWCGFAPPAPPPREAKEIKDVAMQERKFEDPRRNFFEKKLKEAKEKGFKPGFAAAQYKDEFDEWPPWAWSQEAKEKFAADKEWQNRQAGRAAERAHWQARERAGHFKSDKEREEEFLAWARDDADVPLLDPE